MDNRRLFFSFLLSLAVLLIWYTLFPPKPAEPPPTPAREESAAPRGSRTAEAPPPAPAVPASPRTVMEAAAEEQVVLEAEGRRAVFSNRGAQLVSLEVPETSREGSLELVRRRVDTPLPYGLVDQGLQPHPANGKLFQVSRGADGRSAVFRYSGTAGVVVKQFAFDRQGFLESSIEVVSGGPWGVVLGPGVRNPTEAEYNSQFERRSAVYKSGDEVTVVSPDKTPEGIEVPGGGLKWIGVEDNYFLAAAVPRQGVARADIEPVLVEPVAGGGARFVPVPPKDQMSAEQKDLRRDLMVVLRPEVDRLTFLSYWGSKRYETLKALPYGLDETVQLGMFGLLVRPLLLGLHWIYENIVANYGWAIILMTVLIKLLLLPLTHKSTVSMRKMQELNPKIQGIRERYRSKLKDKQGKPNMEMQRKMNEEVMAVYKTEGVNPAGGCLPILLQMPILFAFYSLLSTAVELRGAPWTLWIHDLSAQDPYYVLPLVMGATQFIQVKLAPQAGDPMQRRIFLLMPIFMTFLFLRFPSGLVLYWLTNNVLTIVQQWIYNRLQQKEGKA